MDLRFESGEVNTTVQLGSVILNLKFRLLQCLVVAALDDDGSLGANASFDWEGHASGAR